MDSALLDRFTKDLDALVPPDVRLGVAISGGSDSLALLKLAVSARPGRVEAATIDHQLREGSRDEAEMVARVCSDLSVPHAILAARWDDHPETAVQERARKERYRLLAYWAEERGLGALATAHHAEDQAETMLMRLARGAGVKGLAAMRPRSVTPGAHLRLARPLLSWRRAELEGVCTAAGLIPAQDPSNADMRFERVRVRRALADAEWLDCGAVAHSAANLAAADAALDWATSSEWERRAILKHGIIHYRPDGTPAEIRRRIASKAIRKLATEGDRDLRGSEMDRVLEALANGGTATLRGVRCQGGAEWRFSTAPKRSV